MPVDRVLQPIQRVLIAGPPAGGLGTVEAGVHLARRLGARVRVLQVQPHHPILERLGIAGRPERGIADADIVRLAHRAGLRPSTLETETLKGQPRRVLLDEARSWQADLVVLGSDGQSPPGVRVGTVADHLIRQLACPVLVVDDRRPTLASRVLFPVDLSEFSRVAMACGLDLLRQSRLADEGSERIALLAVPAPRDLTVERRQSIETGARIELETFLADLPGAATVRPAVALGEPASAIVEHAASHADLVIMGTHGYGSLGAARRGVGSVAGQVLGAAPCSILIVPPAAEFAAELAEAVISQTAPRFDKRLFS
jgi:nucleotide-binding universal stress UspA family protein